MATDRKINRRKVYNVLNKCETICQNGFLTGFYLGRSISKQRYDGVDEYSVNVTYSSRFIPFVDSERTFAT